MGVHTIYTVQNIPAAIGEVWSFFSDPANLAKITPPELSFKTLTDTGSTKIHKGQMIEYIVKPLFGVPLKWKTEILDVVENTMFIDLQRKGPYLLWKHQHDFKEIPGGTEMIDTVQYQLPFHVLGIWMHRWLIRKKLKQIFEFRYQKVEELFGKWPGQNMAISFK